MTSSLRLAGPDVYARTMSNAYRKYPNRKDGRFLDGQFFPAVTPTFQIRQSDQVFTIGSCFARNVEEELLARGIQVPTAHYAAPQEEAPGRPNRVLNQYNPGTMLQCVQAVDKGVPVGSLFPAPVDAAAPALPAGEERVIDGLLSTGSRPVTRTRADARRKEIVTLYREGLAVCGVVVLTLGFIELWFDHQSGYFLNEAPSRAVMAKDPARFEFRRLNVPESLDLIGQLVARLQKDRPRKIILTVSPVPLQTTFALGDAITANGYSKAVLRVVADEILRAFPGVDYFPSYEMVTTMGMEALGEDLVHVRPEVVARVVQHMLENYLVKQDT